MIKKILISSTILASLYTNDMMAKDHKCPSSENMVIETDWSKGGVNNALTIQGNELSKLLSGKNVISYYPENGMMLCTYHNGEGQIVYTRETTIGKDCKMVGGPGINCPMDSCIVSCK